MSDLLLFDKDKKEQELLSELAHDTNAYVSEGKLEIHAFLEAEEAEGYVRSGELFEMAMIEVRNKADIAVLRTTQDAQANADLMIVTDASVPPYHYMNGISRIMALLQRPYTVDIIRATLRQFMTDHYRRNQEDSEDVIVVSSRGEKLSIPISKIYFVEVRGKQVFMRLQRTSYSMYGTLESIMEKLPGQFMQCHRSYVFNTDYFQKVKLSENVIYLKDEIQVPLSRTFKVQIKEFVNGL